MGGFQNDPGTIQQEGGFGFDQLFWTESRTDGITAANTGVQGTATTMSTMVNRVTTAAGVAQGSVFPGVALPPGRPSLLGVTVLVINAAANPIQVYGVGADTINGATNTLGVPMMGLSIAYFIYIGNNAWIATGLGFGYATGPSAGFTTYSTQTGIVATPSGTQANSVKIYGTQVQIVTAASSGDSVTLPPALPGMEITIMNNAAVNAVNVFPASATQGGVSGGDKINTGGQNAAFSLAAATSGPTIFYCFTVGIWLTK